jgi:membrane-associated phospholipid phosphatase
MLRMAGILFFAVLCVSAAPPVAAQEATLECAQSAESTNADAAVVDAAVGVNDVPPLKTRTFAFGQIIGKPTAAPPTPEHTGIKAMVRELGVDVKHLPSWENVFWAGFGGGMAGALHPLDSTANAALSGPFLDKFFQPGAILGQSYTLLPVAATIYAVGRSTSSPRISHMGSDLIQSILIAELMTQSIKYSVRRERPDGSGANSFPSGHAADTMAFATALERHFNWKYYLPAYAFATYVAMSRLHDNVHFVSDVAFGSAVGIIAGRTVTRLGHTPFPVAVTSVPGGFAIVYVRQDDGQKQ